MSTSWIVLESNPNKSFSKTFISNTQVMLFLQILFILNGHFLLASFIPKGNFSDLQVYGSFGKKNFRKNDHLEKKKWFRPMSRWMNFHRFACSWNDPLELQPFGKMTFWNKSLRELTCWNIDPITKMGGGNYRNVINGKNFKIWSSSKSFFSLITWYVKEKDEMRYSLDF